MKIYIARQPIYDKYKTLFGYELLYRNSEQNFFPNINAETATRELASHVLSEFDFYALTNQRPGFINFTRETILSDIPLLFNASSIVIELLENIEIDEELIARISFLKNKNYTFALDDFVDDGTYDALLPFVDIIKVEFTLISEAKRKAITQKYKRSKRLLAERIETETDLKKALSEGFTLFQGYYFSKPIMLVKNSIAIANTSYFRLWSEATQASPDFEKLSNIVKLDVGLTYKLLTYINTLVYYRGNRIHSVEQALVYLGINDTKKWIMLLLLRDISQNKNDEITKRSLVRAMFMEKMAEAAGHGAIAQDAYMTGLLSMLDSIFEDSITTVLDKLELAPIITKALVEGTGLIADLLACIKNYEESNWEIVEKYVKKLRLKKISLPDLYLSAVRYADSIFESSIG